MQAQPSYPFFTRFGTIQITAWLSESVTCDVLTPVSYYLSAHINWTRQAYPNRRPNWSDGEDGEILITREDFLAAYHAADAFQAAAELEFLGEVTVVPCTAEQAVEITRLASHPCVSRAARTRALLVIPRLTLTAAALYIDTLTKFISVHEGPVEYAVIGEAFTVKAA